MAWGGLPGCASRYTVPAEHRPAATYFQAPRTVALAPTAASEGYPFPDESLAADWLTPIDRGVDSTLRAAGIETVAVDSYVVLWDAVLDSIGDLYDAETGELDEERFEAARATLFRVLTERFGASAVLYPEVVVVMAGYRGGSATWDGVKRPIRGTGGGLLGFLDAIFAPENVEEGVIVALSLNVFIETTDGTALFEHQAGIEVVDDFTEGEFRTRQDLLANGETIRDAIRLALEPIVRREQ